jgi:AraC-like DNA-binding protein
MKLVQIEHALGMIRTYLVECVAHDNWSDQRTAELTEVIRACVRRLAAEERPSSTAPAARLPREVLRQAIRFVNDNLDSKLRWDEIAADVGMDPFAFGRRFKLSTGMTPHDYVIRCRLRRGMLLLQSTLSLADIALEVGCSCQSHFTTLFRKRLGITPGAFRLSAQDGNGWTATLAAARKATTSPQPPIRMQPYAAGVTTARVRA